VGKSRFTAIRHSPFAVRQNAKPPAVSYQPKTKTKTENHLQLLSFQDFAPQVPRSQDFTGVAQWNQDFTGYLGGGGAKAAIRRSPFARKQKLPATSCQPPAQTCYRRIRLAAGGWELAATNCRSLDSPLGYARGQDDKRYFIALIQETS
jgi:hypothetical protein